MGKGKGVVNIDDWCSRIQSGKALMFFGKICQLSLS